MADFVVLESAYAAGPSGPVLLEAGRVVSDTNFDIARLRSQGVGLIPYRPESMAAAVRGFVAQKGKPGLEGDFLAILEGAGALTVAELFTFFGWILETQQGFTNAQVLAGLINAVFTSADDLPSTPPAGGSAPSFAIVNDGDPAGIALAYYDFVLTDTWVLTRFPFTNTIPLPGHLINQIPGIGTGSSTFNFAMGPEFRCLVGGTIADMTVKVASSGLTHAWALRRSTTPGPTAPLLSSYTIVERSGTHTNGAANTWQSVSDGFGAPVPMAPDDWFVCQVFPGTASGQSFSIATERAAGNLLEDFGFLNRGTFVAVAGPNPGGTAVPTGGSATCFGLCSPDLQA